MLAGVVPLLSKQGNWKFVYFELDENPFKDLARALVSIARDIKIYDREYDDEVDALSIKLRESENNLEDIFRVIPRLVGSATILLIADQLESLYTKCTRVC